MRTQKDVQWALEKAPAEAAVLPVEYLRQGDMVMLRELHLKKGWRLPDELAFSWRASMWQLRPRPGFGGKLLGKEELEGLGLPPATWAVKVGYIVDWGNEAYTGRNARKASIRQGDVILAAAGKRDFHSELHFQSWFRFTQKPGTAVEIEALREGKPLKFELPVLE